MYELGLIYGSTASYQWLQHWRERPFLPQKTLTANRSYSHQSPLLSLRVEEPACHAWKTVFYAALPLMLFLPPMFPKPWSRWFRYSFRAKYLPVAYSYWWAFLFLVTMVKSQSLGAFFWASNSTGEASHETHYTPSPASMTHPCPRPFSRTPISPVACIWLEKRAYTTNTLQCVSGLEHLSCLQESKQWAPDSWGRGIIQQQSEDLALKASSPWPNGPRSWRKASYSRKSRYQK